MQSLVLTDTDQDSAQADIHAYQGMNDQVQRLISVIKQEDYTLAELIQLVGVPHRSTFQKIT